MASVSARRIAGEAGSEGSLVDLMGRYPDEESCERRLIELRWPGGWECPRCGCRECAPVRRRAGIRAGRGHEWQCSRCSLQFSPTVGTAMQGSRMPLRKWFVAIWLESRSKRGVSGAELARELGVNEKTAQYVLRRLRGAMARENEGRSLSGDVEVDDLYVGSPGGGAGRGTSKQALVVAAERGVPASPSSRRPLPGGGTAEWLPPSDEGAAPRAGACCLRVVAGVSGADYRRFAADHLAPEARLHTDGWPGEASGLAGWDVRSARVEGRGEPDEDSRLPLAHHVISNFKAFLQGTFHGAPRAGLQERADEFSWRYSHRGPGSDATAGLLSACLRGFRPLSELRSSAFEPQPAQPPLPAGEAPGGRRGRRWPGDPGPDTGLRLCLCS